MDDTHQLDYYRRRQYVPGWHDVVEIMIAGIAENAGDEDRRQFLNMVGSRLAERFTLQAADTVGTLEDAINRLWADFHWGYVRLQPASHALAFQHYAFPNAPEGADISQWIAGLAAILEGAYAQWLLAQGGQQHVVLRWQQDSAEGVMTFTYQNNP
ncbi:cellulose biosynthesis protein BcsD [Biostraticola tofi]|uniref:Cellulose synthase subunit D n=1 Tax=Biostraticola tofi TaxID=466109 RepID=A0A4R3YUW4_9GAMM|nr:cellulose biosynthesis protein BcsD [Biostraticola tofi]TCV95578.1 cellulose synthase subunit D [Biostraticola tofi]